MGEEARENQNVAQETVSPNGAEGCNPCKPKTTMIPKVILEYPQTQLYRDQMKMQVYGFVAHINNVAQLD
jgi:hypothetical protein